MVRTVKGVTLTHGERKKAGYDKEKTAAHACSVALPNGVPCEVSYTRTSARVHAFAFGDPLCRTQHAYEAIKGGTASIEAKAATLATDLFRQAQQQEQKAMRQKTPPHRAAQKGDGGPQIGARVAEHLAGRYAACVKNASGTLIRVGICNRAAQRWEEPAFLGVPRSDQPVSAVGEIAPARESEDLEDDEGEVANVGNQEGDPICEGGAYDE